MISLFLWCFIWFIWTDLVIPTAANIVAHRDLLDLPCRRYGLGVFARVLAVHPFRQPYHSALWFVRILFLLVLASPVLRRLANPAGVAVLWLLNGLTFPDYGVARTPIVFTFAVGFCSFFAMTWFCLGMMLRLRKINLLIDRKFGAACLLTGMCLLAWRGMPYASYRARLLTWLCTPFLLTGIWCFCPARQWPKWLTSASFPVYTIHLFATTAVSRTIERFRFDLADSPLLSAFAYLCHGILVIALAIGTARCLRKCFPRMSAVLFGGR